MTSKSGQGRAPRGRSPNNSAGVRGFRQSPFLGQLLDPRLLWPFFIVSLILAVAVCIASVGLGEEDIWWHLKTGEWILKNRALPYQDIFTYTTPPGTRWHDTQWLFQILAQLIYGTGGWNGLIAYRAFSVCLLMAALWLWLRKEGQSPFVIFVVCAVCIGAARFRFTVRPELPTFALLAFQLALYSSAYQKGKLPILPLFASQLVWGNWHSSCILGIILAVIFVGIELPTTRLVPKPAEPVFPSKHLIALPVLIAAITLLNPHGDPAKAVEYQERVIDNGMENSDVYFLLANAQHRAGQAAAARKTARRMTRKYPTDPRTAAVRKLVGI